MMKYAGIVLEKDERFLLQLRDMNNKTKNPDKWGIFGGGIKLNETPEKAALREIKEELGIKLNEKDIKPILKVGFGKRGYYIFKSNIQHDFKNIKLKEGKEMRFFSKKEILKLRNIVPGMRIFFRIFV